MDKPSIFISGASSGIGLASVGYFLEKNFSVFASARKPNDLEKISALGATAIKLEMSSEESIRLCVQKLEDALAGKLDYLVNNAAFALPGCVEDLPIDALKHEFDVNVFATMSLTQQLMPLLRASENGRIVFISSMLSAMTMPARAAYCASKYALESLIAGLRMELRGQPIDVISIRPGPIQSQFRQRAQREYTEHIQQHKPEYEHIYQSLAKQESFDKVPFSKPPLKVAQLIHKALSAKRPKTHYNITLPAHLFIALARVLPARAMDFLMTRI